MQQAFFVYLQGEAEGRLEALAYALEHGGDGMGLSRFSGAATAAAAAAAAAAAELAANEALSTEERVAKELARTPPLTLSQAFVAYRRDLAGLCQVTGKYFADLVGCIEEGLSAVEAEEPAPEGKAEADHVPASEAGEAAPQRRGLRSIFGGRGARS